MSHKRTASSLPATVTAVSAYDGLDLIERALNPSGAPVIGLYLTTAFLALIRSLATLEFKIITPHLIGTPAILESRPGISQVELARYLGTTRAAAGKQVAACIGRGWVRRARSAEDSRRYSLYVTPKGKQMLRKAAGVVPRHERLFTAPLSARQRSELRLMLRRLIIGR